MKKMYRQDKDDNQMIQHSMRYDQEDMMHNIVINLLILITPLQRIDRYQENKEDKCLNRPTIHIHEYMEENLK